MTSENPSKEEAAKLIDTAVRPPRPSPPSEVWFACTRAKGGGVHACCTLNPKPETRNPKRAVGLSLARRDAPHVGEAERGGGDGAGPHGGARRALLHETKIGLKKIWQ